MDKNQICEKSRKIVRANDFMNWELRDMSELFWMKLGEYVKNPTSEALILMLRAWEWACHSDHALANSFTHAIHWAGITDWWEEAEKRGFGWK